MLYIVVPSLYDINLMSMLVSAILWIRIYPLSKLVSLKGMLNQ